MNDMVEHVVLRIDEDPCYAINYIDWKRKLWNNKHNDADFSVSVCVSVIVLFI